MNSTLNTISTMKYEAHALVAFGYQIVPIEYGGKRPLVPWKELACDHRAVDEWFERFPGGINLAIHAGKSGVIGLDADTEAAALWIEAHCPATPMWASTPRGGMHAYFRAPEDAPPPAQDLFGIGLDIKSGTSLIVASPSWSAEHDRRWEWIGDIVPPGELPEIPAALIRREPLSEPIIANSGHDARVRATGPIRDLTRWIMEVESVQGSGGSNQCFRVACRLVDAGLEWKEALKWLRLWNERKARPPWSEAELEHKLRGAFDRT